MPSEEVRIVVTKPLADIESELRRKFRIGQALLGVSIEKEAIVFTFAGSTETHGSQERGNGTSVGPDPSSTATNRKRRKRRIRNRTKTRGWDVVAKIKNSRGQTCTIYRPIVDALQGRHLPRKEAYAAVRKIITQNGNDPNPSTVEYFLNNTLEFLSTGREEKIAKDGP